MKLFFILPVLLFLYHVPVFFMFYDFGRWMVMIIQIQFMLILYLIYTGNKTVLTVTANMVPAINKNWYIIIVICSLMFFLGPVLTIGPSERVSNIIKGCLELFKIAL
ncbi:MAG: hypothetical protein FWE72_00240 [Spirochaetaceae bacterium]|nr:hypothetical protein [Spirochaetaceae bacterium]